MDPSTSLQIPDSSIPGPSRQHGVSRAVSVSVQPNSSQSQPSRKRASHTVVSSQHQQPFEEQPSYHDVYSHPAAVAYAAAHPRRSIPKFGPYLLLQTLGEGEFGKVKLGLHSQWGEEVAVKLIRRGNIDTTVRMSKVEREIEVLRTLKHPNIVRLYDVIETDKYIGIILEYASGGELFDHILAHRYLKEKDAAKLFSQLVSGVWYIHEKKIVHRDLKLENLLLDRHRNVIITDFGFANRFEHRSDDLMQTSCGSPCYAAPELVISEGLYVGSAVDIWSCGVILYAMLAGYLPFDDDPANPDGDNINLLYKYIVNTPLSFPEYISPEARDLLSMMLVPDPTRRADLSSVMAHPWLASYGNSFAKTVEELEKAAMDQHQMKRLAYQKQMRQAAAAAAKSSRPPGEVFDGPSSSTTRSHRHHLQAITQPEYLYQTTMDPSSYTSQPGAPSRKGFSSERGLPSQVPLDDDPFAPDPRLGSQSIPTAVSPSDDVTLEGDARGEPRAKKVKEEGTHRSRKGSGPAPAKQSPERSKKGGRDMRHTIQVEYDDPDGDLPPARSPQKTVTRETDDVLMINAENRGLERSMSKDVPASGSIHKRRKQSQDKPLPIAPASSPAAVRSKAARPAAQQSPSDSQAESTANAGLPSQFVVSSESKAVQPKESGSSGSAGSRKSQHRKGLSVGGLGKVFGTNTSADQTLANGTGSRLPSEKSDVSVSPSLTESVHRRPSTLQPQVSPESAVGETASKSSLLSPGSDSKKGRRSTLTVMVGTLRSRSKKAADTPPKEKPVKEKKTPQSDVIPLSTEKSVAEVPQPLDPNASRTSFGMGMAASTNKARKVMQWFRKRNRDPNASFVPGADEIGCEPRTPTQAQYRSATDAGASSTTLRDGQPSPILVVTTPPGDQSRSIRAIGHPQRSASAMASSSGSTSLAERVRRSINVGGTAPSRGVMRIHHGAVDGTTITTMPPPDVMKHIREVLMDMGIEIQLENDFKYRCQRPKRKKSHSGVGLGLKDGGSNGLAAFTMVGSAASNGVGVNPSSGAGRDSPYKHTQVDKRGLPVPSNSFGSNTGGMLKGLWMRRQSSQVSSSNTSQPSLNAPDDDAPPLSSEPLPVNEAVYGDPSHDAGDEVKFSVELTRIDGLNDTYSLDIRRVKGNLRSYKFLYDTIRQRADLTQ